MSKQAEENVTDCALMSDRIDAFDWAKTSLGVQCDWPAELKMAVNIMLALEVPVALYWGPELVVLYNDACRLLLRDKHPDALGQSAQTVFAEAWQGVGPQLASIMSGNGREEQYADESKVPWLTGRLTLLPLANGSSGGVMHSVSEAAEVQQLHQTLLSSDERNQFLERALSHMGDYVYVWDRHKNFVYANERLENLWGLSRDGYRGKSLVDIGYPPALTDLLTQQIDHVITTGEPIAGITPYVNSAGTQDHYEYIFNPLVSPDGNVQFVAGVSRDVTERQRTAEALRKSEQRYRALFESIDEGFCVFEMLFDAEGKPTDYRWLETNPAFGRHTGLVNAEGRTARELVPDLEAHWLEIYGHIALTGEQHRFVEYSPAMGRWFEVDAFRVGDADECKVALLFSDITQRKETEQALKEADQRKDEFLATLAHELRNPLAAIRSGVEIMKLAQENPSTKGDIYPYQTMERQTQQLVSLVDDLLEVSRITRGTLELRKSHVDLTDIITSALESCQPLIEQAGHTLTQDLPAETVVLEADRHRLAQVLSNLVNNAAKYTPTGGHISLIAKAQSDHVVITVKDSGIGIPADRLEHIFEMFAQISGAHDNNNQGLGVGLALAKSLVEMHGGNISVASAGAGQGSTFTVYLPLPAKALTTEIESEIMQPDAPTAGRYRVLIVDDNLDAASTLSMLIEMLGNDVRTAQSGQQALDLADTFRPQVIFMDLGMPDMDGFAATQQIREQPWGRDMLIVALSGWGQDEDKRKTREAGFDHHLVKPTELSALKEVLARLD